MTTPSPEARRAAAAVYDHRDELDGIARVAGMAKLTADAEREAWIDGAAELMQQQLNQPETR